MSTANKKGGIGASWLIIQGTVSFIAVVFSWGFVQIFGQSTGICAATNPLLPGGLNIIGGCTGGYIIAGAIAFFAWNLALIFGRRRLRH